jgi:hypothetical protein
MELPELVAGIFWFSIDSALFNQGIKSASTLFMENYYRIRLTSPLRSSDCPVMHLPVK